MNKTLLTILICLTAQMGIASAGNRVAQKSNGKPAAVKLSLKKISAKLASRSHMQSGNLRLNAYKGQKLKLRATNGLGKYEVIATGADGKTLPVKRGTKVMNAPAGTTGGASWHTVYTVPSKATGVIIQKDYKEMGKIELVRHENPTRR